ncbi:hypothetical protein C0J52_12240 [Blattella germanica]|nr:hypothetical protein C0J52_12240 [Blattella germanica]
MNTQQLSVRAIRNAAIIFAQRRTRGGGGSRSALRRRLRHGVKGAVIRNMSTLPVLLLMFLGTSSPSRAARLLDVLFEWKDIEYAFPNHHAKDVLIKTRAYIPGNSIAIDVDAWEQGNGDNQVFVTIPRFKPGVPASLATIVLGKDGSPKLLPYPDWSWHREGNCEGITSVFRTQIDQCGRLWVLDSGMVEVLGNIKRICQPQVLVFNLKNNKLLLRYRIPDSVLMQHSILTTIVTDVLDVTGSCREAFAYITDVSGFGLIVVDAHREKSWRVVSNYFYPYPLHGHFELNNEHFELMDGVLSLAISPNLNSRGDKMLYFHSLASVRESWVSTSVLRNESNFKDGINRVPEMFYVSQGTRPGQAAASAMDGEGAAVFFSVLPKNSLNCWNPRLPYNDENIVEIDRDDVTFQFASGLKIIQDRKGKEWVWALTSRFQNVMVGKMDPENINYRVLRAPVEELVKGTSCAAQRSQSFISVSQTITEHSRNSGYVPFIFP